MNEYEKLVEDVKNDYQARAKNNISNSPLIWCELCEEINLWTYWQGRRNNSAKILLVGQDWGCIFDDYFDKFKKLIVKMNTGDNSINYAEHLYFPTDMSLIKLFEVLGYDLHKKNKDLFFTNLVLGYRKNGSSGGLPKKYLLKDVEYLCRLVCILKPKVIICLGKVTYEIVASALCSKKIQIEKYYKALDNAKNYCDCYVNTNEKVRIYAVSHCGSFGTMNRKRYASKVNDKEEGLDLQKKDWLRIKEYLEKND